MQEKKLGSYGTISLIVTLIITKAFITAPTLYVQHSLSGGWLEVLISGVFEIFVLSIILKLLSDFDNMDLIDISEIAFGRIGKICIGIGSLSVIILNSAAVFRCFGELIRNTVIKGVSYESTAFFLITTGIIAAYLGLKTQVNLNGLIVPLLIVSVIIVFCINFSRYSVSNIQPILGTGLTDILSDALLKNASYFELGIILFIIPSINGKNSVKRICFTSLIVSVIVLSSITLFYQLSMPYEAAKTFSLPLYQMTRMLKAGTFFQRIEPLCVFLWAGTSFIYVGVGIWLSMHIFSKTFNITDGKPLVFIIAEIICILALIPGSQTSVERIYDFIMTYGYIAYPILPIIILVIAVTRLKKKSGCVYEK